MNNEKITLDIKNIDLISISNALHDKCIRDSIYELNNYNEMIELDKRLYFITANKFNDPKDKIIKLELTYEELSIISNSLHSKYMMCSYIRELDDKIYNILYDKFHETKDVCFECMKVILKSESHKSFEGEIASYCDECYQKRLEKNKNENHS